MAEVRQNTSALLSTSKAERIHRDISIDLASPTPDSVLFHRMEARRVQDVVKRKAQAQRDCEPGR